MENRYPSHSNMAVRQLVHQCGMHYFSLMFSMRNELFLVKQLPMWSAHSWDKLPVLGGCCHTVVPLSQVLGKCIDTLPDSNPIHHPRSNHLLQPDCVSSFAIMKVYALTQPRHISTDPEAWVLGPPNPQHSHTIQHLTGWHHSMHLLSDLRSFSQFWGYPTASPHFFSWCMMWWCSLAFQLSYCSLTKLQHLPLWLCLDYSRPWAQKMWSSLHTVLGCWFHEQQ